MICYISYRTQFLIFVFLNTHILLNQLITFYFGNKTKNVSNLNILAIILFVLNIIQKTILQF